MRRPLNDLSLSGVVDGFVALLVGCTTSVALVFAAAWLHNPSRRRAAVVTSFVTVSSLSLRGVGSACRGPVAGNATLFVQQWRAKGPI